METLVSGLVYTKVSQSSWFDDIGDTDLSRLEPLGDSHPSLQVSLPDIQCSSASSLPTDCSKVNRDPHQYAHGFPDPEPQCHEGDRNECRPCQFEAPPCQGKSM